MISEFRQKLDKFKSWIKEPRLYIVDELDEIKNDIDIFAERFLMKASKSKTKSEAQITLAHNKINSNRREMIDAVEEFEKKLLANMPTNELEAEFAKSLTLFTVELDKKLQDLEKEPTPEKELDFEHAIDSAIYEFDCVIKQKSSVMFIDVFLLKKSLNSHHDEFTGDYARRQAEYLGIKLPDPKMECDMDEDEVELTYPIIYIDLDAETVFGVLCILNDCVRKEAFM